MTVAGWLRGSAAIGWLLLASVSGAAQSADLADKAARARAAMEQQHYDEAVELYADVVRAAPRNAGLRMNLGLALHQAGQYERAAVEFERVTVQQPTLTPAWLMLAMARLKVGATEAAIDPLERVISREPGNALARLELADAHLSLGRAAAAARHFDALVQAEPDSTKGWLGLARSYGAMSREAFRRLEATAADSAYWAVLIARSRASSQQYRSAFGFYRLALSRDSRVRGVHAALADIYRETGHPDWAEEEARRERALPPVDCGAAPLVCEFARGRYREIVERLADADTPEALYWRSLACSELALAALAKLDGLPPSAELHAARAEGLRIRGLHAKSIQEWQAALQLAPDDQRLKGELAQAYWLNQDYAQARTLLESLLQSDPGAPMLNLALGDTLLQLQMPEAAIPYLERALAHPPEPEGTRAALARAYARAGTWDRALPHLEAAIASDTDGSLHVLLARAYASAGRPADAERTRARAQALAEAAAARRERTNEEQQIVAPDS